MTIYKSFALYTLLIISSLICLGQSGFIGSHYPNKDFLSGNKPHLSLASLDLLDVNDINDQFAKATQILMSYFKNTTGVWDDPNCLKPRSCVNGTGWWYWGNAAHILADYQKYSSSGRQDFSWALKPIFTKNLDEMTSSHYFDDEGWWGLALIRFYKLTNDTTYLNQAKKIANDMKNRGKQSICGNGGIFWDASHTQVGAIANELFISLNAKIALIDDPDGSYKQNAIDTWKWLNSSKLISSSNLVLDHYNVINNKTCGELINWTFTYTNGVILSALMDLTTLTGDFSYSEKAGRIARVAMTRFAPNGIINDDYTGSPKNLAEDGLLFKGIFVDNLASVALQTKDLTLKAEIVGLLLSNYNILIFTQGTARTYGYLWEKNVSSDNPADIVTHLSAMYLLDSIAQLKYRL